jgi:hypothetical protein
MVDFKTMGTPTPIRVSKNDVLRNLHEVTAKSPSTPFKAIVGEPFRLIAITGPHAPLKTTLNQTQPFYVLDLVDEAGALFTVWSAHAALVKYWAEPSLRQLLRQGETVWMRVDAGTTKDGRPQYTLALLDAPSDEPEPAELPFE